MYFVPRVASFVVYLTYFVSRIASFVVHMAYFVSRGASFVVSGTCFVPRVASFVVHVACFGCRYRRLVVLGAPYAGKLDKAIEDFQESAALIDEDYERELAFAIRGNLSATFVRAGNANSALRELEHARRLFSDVDDPLGTLKLDWITGDLAELQGDLAGARRLYQAAREGFRKANEPRYSSMVSVDLMTIHSQQGEWDCVSELAADTLPILMSLNLHSETIAAVALLAEAVPAKGLSRQLLSDLRIALRQDPLAM